MPTARNTGASAASGPFALGDSADALSEPGRGATGPRTSDLCAAGEGPLERLARLHAELGRTYAELARNHDIQLAVGADLSVMGAMPNCAETVAGLDPLLTVADLAVLLQVDARTVRRWRSEGKLPDAVELGGVIRWDSGVVRSWLAAGGRP